MRELFALKLHQLLMTSGFRRLIARLLIAVFVFAQMATAAHACVSLALDAASVSAGRGTTVASSMPPGRTGQLIAAVENAVGPHCGAPVCNAAAPVVSNVCDAHCQSEQQRVDASSSITVPAAIMTTSYLLPPLDRGTVQRGLDQTWLSPADAALPPHSILHCCFRL
jgi:predicted nucleic acid-binding Zn ribbon protein